MVTIGSAAGPASRRQSSKSVPRIIARPRTAAAPRRQVLPIRGPAISMHSAKTAIAQSPTSGPAPRRRRRAPAPVPLAGPESATVAPAAGRPASSKAIARRRGSGIAQSRQKGDEGAVPMPEPIGLETKRFRAGRENPLRRARLDAAGAGDPVARERDHADRECAPWSMSSHGPRHPSFRVSLGRHGTVEATFRTRNPMRHVRNLPYSRADRGCQADARSRACRPHGSRRARQRRYEAHTARDRIGIYLVRKRPIPGLADSDDELRTASSPLVGEEATATPKIKSVVASAAKQSSLRCSGPGLLRCARNDGHVKRFVQFWASPKAFLSIEILLLVKCLFLASAPCHPHAPLAIAYLRQCSR